KDAEKAKVYHQICLSPGITRKSIVKELSLRPTSVSNIVAELISQRMVYEGNLQNDGKKGRPEITLFMNPNLLLSIAVYVVSKQLKAVLINMSEEVLQELSMNVSSDMKNEEFMDTLVSLIKPLQMSVPNGSNLVGVGLSFFGNFNKIRQELIFSVRWPNIKNFSFKELSKRIGCKVLISTSLEAKLAHLLLEESTYRNGGTLLYHWGYGIGATYAMNGELLGSTPGYIMEAGHIAVDLQNDKVCRCGNVGCLETEAALWSLLPTLQESYPDVPENENEFRTFYLDHHLSKHPSIRRASQMVAHNIATLYQILHPERIVFISPFIMDDDLFEEVKTNFFAKTSHYTHDNIVFVRLQPEFRGEIYGSTYPLFKNRLIKELTAK
ncbi:MAG: ROK family protein, partial [Spirochaetia bacterium]|nr:ROK family protein [Spirochaetia bacterium]